MLRLAGLITLAIQPLNHQTASAGTPVFRTVVLSGGQAPGAGPGVTFRFHSIDPVINAAGQTAFEGILTGPGVDGTNDLGILSGETGTLALVAREVP